MTFWVHYWWPSMEGNGPEDLTSLIIVGVLGGIFLPRIKRWWTAREQAIHAKLDGNAKKLAHIIEHHPEIPNLDHEGNSLIGEK